MQVNTKKFGVLEIEETDIIAFAEGLPGFEMVRKFTVLDNEQGQPFKWLQSIDNPELAFIIINPFEVLEDYDINISESYIKTLEIESEEDILIFSIVVIPEDISKMSINLKAPIIINKNRSLGMQVILDTDKYSVRHYILEELRKQGVENSAGSNKKKR